MITKFFASADTSAFTNLSLSAGFVSSLSTSLLLSASAGLISSPSASLVPSLFTSLLILVVHDITKPFYMRQLVIVIDNTTVNTTVLIYTKRIL